MKPIVHYRPTQSDYIEEGSSALVHPLDHTNHAPGQLVSNTQYARTSTVVRVVGNGVFETLNTTYVPEGVTYP